MCWVQNISLPTDTCSFLPHANISVIHPCFWNCPHKTVFHAKRKTYWNRNKDLVRKVSGLLIDQNMEQYTLKRECQMAANDDSYTLLLWNELWMGLARFPNVPFCIYCAIGRPLKRPHLALSTHLQCLYCRDPWKKSHGPQQTLVTW